MSDDLIKKIWDLERQVEHLQSKVSWLMARQSERPPEPAPAPSPDPVVIAPPPVVQRLPKPAVISDALPPRPAPKPAVSAKNIGDVEYRLGTQGLLWAGAIAIVLSIIFLVTWAISSNRITLTQQFIGELLLCVGFIGLGLWKREEKENFGQVLIGIGSCGFYVSLAAAHAYKGVLSADALVVLFLALSLVNLGFGWWRAASPFVILGGLGGWTAAYMPMAQDKVELTLLLHFAILIPVLLICVRRHWPALLMVAGLISLILMVSPLFSNAGPSYDIKLICFYANAVVVALAFAWLQDAKRIDPNGIYGPLLLISAGILGFIGAKDHVSIQLLVLSGLSLAACALVRDSFQRSRFALAGALILTLMVPWGYEGWQAMAAYSVQSIVLAVASARRFRRALGVLAWLNLIGAYFAYLVLIASGPVALRSEIGLLTLLMLASSVASYMLSRTQDPQGAFLTALALNCLLALRMIYLLTHQAGALMTMGVASTLFLCAVILIAAAWTTGRRWKEAFNMLWVLYMAALLFGGMGVVMSSPPDPDELMVLGALLLSTAQMCRNARRLNGPEVRRPLILWGGIIGSSLLMRGFFLLLHENLPQSQAFFVACLLTTMLAVGIAAARRWVESSWLAWGGIVLCILPLLGSAQIPWSVQSMTWALAFMTLLLPIHLVIQRRLGGDRGLLLGMGGLLTSILASQLFFVLLTAWAGVGDNAAGTISMTLCAILFMIGGFRWRFKLLRYFGLTMFAFAGLKVLLVDLSSQSIALKIAALGVLGITMIAGSYVYIRLQSLWNTES